jgi:hypothetical protein
VVDAPLRPNQSEGALSDHAVGIAGGLDRSPRISRVPTRSVRRRLS